MMKCKGTFEDAIGCLTVATYESARKELFKAIGLEPQSRSAWGKYVKGETPMKVTQMQACRAVFAKYGIEWDIHN